MGDYSAEQQSTVTAGAVELGNQYVGNELWLLSTENDAIELSEFLEASSEKTFEMKVKIIDDPCWHPMVFQTAASYITINGNEELCGSSFSDSDTSYMVGIAGSGGLVVSDGGAWDWWTEMEENGDCLGNATSCGGCCYDDMLAAFVGDDNVAQT